MRSPEAITGSADDKGREKCARARDPLQHPNPLVAWVRFPLPIQPVIATQPFNRSAGVS